MSRSPLDHEPPLLEPERAIRLAEDATAAFHDPHEHEDHDLGHLAVMSKMDAALVALETAIDTGDPQPAVEMRRQDPSRRRSLRTGRRHARASCTA